MQVESLPRGSLFSLDQYPFTGASDEGIGKADSSGLYLIAAYRNRFVTLANYGSAIAIDLHLHVLRLSECARPILMDIVEQSKLIFGVAVRADESIVIGEDALEKRHVSLADRVRDLALKRHQSLLHVLRGLRRRICRLLLR
jgi:hypothetical protein